jgi:hypothetical protein
MAPKLHKKLVTMAQEIQMGHRKCEKDGLPCPLYHRGVNLCHVFEFHKFFSMNECGKSFFFVQL